MTDQNRKIILASGSKTRAMLLKNAGITASIDPSRIDEDAVKQAFLADDGSLSPADMASLLAEAKAIDVAARHPGSLVIGADQTLEFKGELFSKAATIENVRQNLLSMRGKPHLLHAAAVIAHEGAVIERIEASATLTFRDFSPEFLGRYLASVGDAALSSVGGYQLEGVGLQLFESIDGDFFTVLGMPLLPLIAALRRHRGLDT